MTDTKLKGDNKNDEDINGNNDSRDNEDKIDENGNKIPNTKIGTDSTLTFEKIESMLLNIIKEGKPIQSK